MPDQIRSTSATCASACEPTPRSYLFTSESVTEGHPDKIADQISDAVLDAILNKEARLEAMGYVDTDGVPAKLENVRCAAETLLTTGMVVISGEIRTQAYVDVQQIARDVICRIGYDRAEYGFDGHACGVINMIHGQSSDIAQGVDESFDVQAGTTTDPLDLIGAGDQGMMFGYATDETSAFMPMPHYLASRLAERLAAVRHDGTLPYLRPDGKTQVTVRYEDDRPVSVETVVISTQHAPEIEDMGVIKKDMLKHVIAPVLDGAGIPWDGARVYVNPTGRFVVGGPMGAARSSSTPTAARVVTAVVPSRARTARRSIVPLPTPRAGWLRTWSPPALPAVARFSSPTLSAWRVRSPSWSTRSGRLSSPRMRSNAPWKRCSIFAPAPSSATSTCAVPSTRRRRPMGTSVVTTRTLPGSIRTAWTSCAPRAASRQRASIRGI